MPVDPMSTFEDAEPASADKHTSESRAPVDDEKDESIMYITLTLEEYQRIVPNMLSEKPEMRGDWKELLYDKFYTLWPTCPIVFTYSHVRKLDSRKQYGCFWHAKAVCQNCITVDFYICTVPTINANVVVKVRVNGHCSHLPSNEHDASTVTGRRGRRLQGTQRQEKAHILTTRATTANKEYYKQLSNMPSSAVAAGNVMQCKSPGVFHQAAYECRLKQQLHPDMIVELRMQRKDWAASEGAASPPGFIQSIGDSPFYCTFYLREQVELYIEVCKSNGSVHCKATGTVVKDIPDNKRVLYYTVIPSDCNVPVMEFLTAQHTTETISYLLELFLHDVRTVNSGVTVKPQYIVTDFSYAIINACVQVFNN